MWKWRGFGLLSVAVPDDQMMINIRMCVITQFLSVAVPDDQITLINIQNVCDFTVIILLWIYK